MSHHTAVDSKRHRSTEGIPVPFPHLLSCSPCAEQVQERARESNPGIRVDLFPGDECPNDEVLAVLARERPCDSELEHLRHCLWCTLSVRHFASMPDYVPAAPQHRHILVELLRNSLARPLPPSAEMEFQGDFLSIRSPLDRRIVRFLLNPKHSVQRLIPLLITRRELPFSAPDGTPMSYSLEWKEGGRRLEGHETLTGAGLKGGDRLYLVPEIGAPLSKK